MKKWGFVFQFVLSIALMSGPIASHAKSDVYPTRPITLIVPFAAGGATDISARKISEILVKLLGQPIVVENRAGAGGLIGMTAVARATPDGYTLGWGGNSPLTIAPFLSKKPPYDPAKAFAPISLACVSSFTYTVRKGLGVQSMKQLVELARARPGQVTFASSGVGTSTHMLGELLKTTARVDLLHVPYKGETEGFQGMFSGQVDVMATSTPGVMAQLQAGRIVGLATTGNSREAQSPSIPTVSEAGFPDLQMELFFGLVAPAGTPQSIVDRLNSEMKKAVADPAFAEVMKRAGYSAQSSSASEFSILLNRHATKWRKVILENRISTD